MNETFLYLVLSAFSFLLAVIAVILKCSQSRKKPGSLQLILGPMFAGKSTLLVRMAKWRRFCGSRCIIVKYASDNRYDEIRKNAIVTHNGQHIDALPLSSLGQLDEALRKKEVAADTIFVDEMQFFEDAHLLADWADNGIEVIGAGLHGTAEQKMWASIVNLIARSDLITWRYSSCKYCGQNASHSFRLKKKEETATDVEVGAGDKFAPACRACFNVRCAAQVEAEIGNNNENCGEQHSG